MSSPDLPPAPTPARPSGAAVITGCAGFIGGHLSEALIDRGWDILGIDNFATGKPANMVSAQTTGRFNFLEHDVTAPFADRAPSTTDLVVNLAAIAAPARYAAAPVETFRTGVLGAMHAADMARAKGAALLQTSTSEIYGAAGEGPLVETDWGHANPIGPRACYAEGKRAAEACLTDLARAKGLDLRLARLFNVYGPRMDPSDGRVVSAFVRQALQGEALTVFGDGRQTRSFCYIDDATDALLRLATAPAPGPMPINIGNPEEITVLELADIVRDLVGGAPDVTFLPALPEDPPRRRPAIDRAKAILNWSPKTTLKAGLQQTIEAMEQEMSRTGATR